MTFDDFLRQSCPLFDLEWRKYRRRSPRHRVAARMAELKLTDYSEYLSLLSKDPEESKQFPDLMRVTVSRFFREHDCWETLSNKILPAIMPASGTVVAWSAGCCGGEEPYSLAILWLERFQKDYPACTLQILATDIDDDALKRGESGEYHRASLREAPDKLLNRYFRCYGDIWRVNDEVREFVLFRRHNIMSETLPTEADLILCRYLPFTYFRGSRLMDAAARLATGLRKGGALMTGWKEQRIPQQTGLFVPWPHAAPFFTKAAVA